MERFIHSHVWIRENLLFFIGISLCVYFSFHIFMGQRSLLQMNNLKQEIQTLSSLSNNYMHEKLAFEQKVKMMRPGSIDSDLLEEQVRLVLGYAHEDEIIVVSYKTP